MGPRKTAARGETLEFCHHDALWFMGAESKWGMEDGRGAIRSPRQGPTAPSTMRWELQAVSTPTIPIGTHGHVPIGTHSHIPIGTHAHHPHRYTQPCPHKDCISVPTVGKCVPRSQGPLRTCLSLPPLWKAQEPVLSLPSHPPLPLACATASTRKAVAQTA